MIRGLYSYRRGNPVPARSGTAEISYLSAAEKDIHGRGCPGDYSIPGAAHSDGSDVSVAACHNHQNHQNIFLTPLVMITRNIYYGDQD